MVARLFRDGFGRDGIITEAGCGELVHDGFALGEGSVVLAHLAGCQDAIETTEFFLELLALAAEAERAMEAPKKKSGARPTAP